MAKTNIGRVSVVPKDEYSSTENYKRLDVVSDNGSMYISKKDNNQGNPLTDKNWWFKAVEKGEVGPQGEKPVNGVDYNTAEEKEEFKNDVVSKATEEVEKNIADIETEAIENYNENATQKTTEYDTNASNKLKAYNDNTTEKLKEYNDNASEKLESYNTNSTSKVNEFNTNASIKTTEFDTNATNKTNTFNDNYDEKMQAINEASTSIEAERIESDKRYSKAIDSDIVSVNGFGQVEVDQDGYMKDIEIESTLPEITQDTREGYNKLELTLETQSINGLDITVNSDKSITLNGTLTNNIGIFISDFKNMQAGKFTSVINSNQALTNKDYYIDYRDSNSIRYGITKFSNKLKVFELSESNDIRAFLWIGTGITLENLTIKPMLIEGEYTEDNLPIYEQYGVSPSLDYPSKFKNTLNTFNIKNTVDEVEKYNKQILLPENKFLGTFNGYKNYIKDNKLKSNLKIITLDGTEKYTIQSTDTNTIRFKLDLSLDTNVVLDNTNLNYLCNYLKAYKYNERTEDKEGIFIGATTSSIEIYIRVSLNEIASIDDFKEFLSSKAITEEPFKILLQCGEEEISLEDINLPLYKGINNISAENLKVNIKYNISIKKYVEESNANERKISDSKYPKALKAQVKDAQQEQIYAENLKVEELKIKGAPLTQVVTEQSENIILLEDYPTTNNNGVDITIKNNKITLSGTATTDINLQLPIKYKLQNIINGDMCLGYISSGDLNSGNGNLTLYSTTSDENIGLYLPKNANYPLQNYAHRVVENFEIDHINLYLNSSVVIDNLVIDFTLVNVASLDAGIPFTPASPSLDFPSEIKVSDEQKILICRKNLIKSIQFMDNMNTYGWVLRFKAPLKPNTKYTIGLKGAKNNKYYLAEDLVVGGGTVNTVTMTGNMQYFTFTTKDNINVTPTYVENEGGYILLKNIIKQPNAHIFEDMILVEGTVNEAYEAYEGQELSIPLQNLTIGDYSDVIDKDSGIQDKLVQEIIFDGTENWILGNEKEKTKVFHINIDMTAIYGIGICNYLPYRSNVDEELINYAGGAIYIAINKTRISNSEELKALLAQLYQSGKPIKLYLVRQDAIKIPLSEEVKQELDKFKLFNGLNNVFIDNGSLSFKYNKSLLRALQEKDDEIYNLQSQIDEIKTLLSSTSTASLLLENLANDNESEVS